MMYRLAILTCALALSWVGHAEASCRTPPNQLLWSYPGDGAADVPIDSELWVLVPWGQGTPLATLNGLPLTVLPNASETGVLHMLPSTLEPNRDYRLQLAFQAPLGLVDAGAASTFEISFRTGSASASAPVAPQTLDHTILPTFADAPCPDLLHLQDCFDTGPNAVHRYQTAASSAIAWLVDGELIPAAQCGAPLLLKHQDARICVDLRAIGPGGRVSAPVQVCTADASIPDTGTASADAGSAVMHDAGDAGASTDDGCHVAATRVPWESGLVLLSLLRRRRRRKI